MKAAGRGGENGRLQPRGMDHARDGAVGRETLSDMEFFFLAYNVFSGCVDEVGAAWTWTWVTSGAA